MRALRAHRVRRVGTASRGGHRQGLRRVAGAIACASDGHRRHGARRSSRTCRSTSTTATLLRIPRIDAVDIVVPNHLHAEIGCAALEAGKDVLLEKPMATTVEDCDRLLAAAAAHGRVLSIGHELRLSSQWGAHQASDRRGRDRRAALCPRHPLSLSLPAGQWRLALRRAARSARGFSRSPCTSSISSCGTSSAGGDPRSVLAVGNDRGRGRPGWPTTSPPSCASRGPCTPSSPRPWPGSSITTPSRSSAARAPSARGGRAPWTAPGTRPSS